MSLSLKSLHKPFIVNFEVTSQCNQQCVFCSAQLSKYSREDLPTKVVLRILSKIAKANIYSIFLTGGEPFIRQDLPLIVKECLSYGMNVSLSTNGTEVTTQIAKRIASVGLEEIQVSIHALDSTHDKIVGVHGAFERSFAGLQNLVKAGLRVTVAAVATRASFKQLPELAEKTARMGARHFRVLRLIPHSEETLRQTVPHNEIRIQIRRLKQLEKELKDFTIEIHTLPGFSDTSTYDPREYGIVHPLCHTCTAGKLSMGILSDGDCVPCLELKEREFVCGNILYDSFSKIWHSDSMSLLRRTTPDRYTGKCGQCELKWTCYSARCVSYHLHHDLLGDDPSCYRLLG